MWGKERKDGAFVKAIKFSTVIRMKVLVYVKNLKLYEFIGIYYDYYYYLKLSS